MEYKRKPISKGTQIGGCIYLYDVDPDVRSRKARFRCMCGKEFVDFVDNVKHGKTCGCSDRRRNNIYVEGLSYKPIYHVWVTMRHRCNSPKNQAYKYYGGRGIKVCDEWESSFEAFYYYISSLENYNKEGYSIDRIDNDGNYEPGNVRWATAKQQTQNRRKSCRKIA